MSSRPTARAGLRRPDFGPMQHRSFRAETPGIQQQPQQHQQQQHQQQQRVIRRRTIVDGSLAHVLQQSKLDHSSYRQTRAYSLLGSQLGESSGAGSVAVDSQLSFFSSSAQQAVEGEGAQDRIQTASSWRTTTTATTASSSPSAAIIPGYPVTTAGQSTVDDTLQDLFTTSGSAPAAPRRSLPRTPRRRSQTPSQTTAAPRRSSLRALAEADELMRRQSMVGAQRLAPISRSDYSPMNVIRLLSRVPGFAPAPQPSSGRGPIPGSEHWRKLTPKSERTRHWPTGTEADQEDAQTSSARKRRLSNPFLQNDQWDETALEGADGDAARRRDLTDVSMEYKLGGGEAGDEVDVQEGGGVDGQATPGGQGALADGEQVPMEDPFDMSWQDARRERSLLMSEGEPTGEMSVGRLSQILGEKAVLHDDDAAAEDAQMPLDQEMDDQLPGDDQQGRKDEGGAIDLQGEDGWEDVPEGVDIPEKDIAEDVQEAVYDDEGLLGPDEANGAEPQVEEPIQDEQQEEEALQDQQDDEAGWQDEEDQDGAQGRRDANQVVFLDDLPSELGMMSNGQFLPVDKPKGKQSVRMSKKGIAVPSLPASLQRQLVQTFARSRFSREAMEEINEASHLFFEQVSSDLAAYATHAGRRTIDDADVECLMRRLRLTNPKVSMESLLHRYLPRELRDLVLFPKELRPPGQR